MEDLNKANENFKTLLEKIRKKKKFDKDAEALFYLFYLEGFKDGSGEVTSLKGGK